MAHARFNNEAPSPSRSPAHHHNMYQHNVIMNQRLGMGQQYKHHGHNYSSSTSQNGRSQNGDAIGNASVHWQQQLQYASESRQGAQNPHRHCKRLDAVQLLSRDADKDDGRLEDGREERHRAVSVSGSQKQEWDALDFSGQGLKALSRPVFTQFLFLRRLFLDHNLLSRLDPAIGRLRALTHLDISGNHLLELPPEVGMLVNLKTLLMFDNQLSVLPMEVGHLYKLEILGIEGNPWTENYKAHLNDHGTKSFIATMRDHYLDPPEPPPREWVDLPHTETSDSLSVLSFNILCEKYATPSQYGYTPAKALAWENRRELVLSTLLNQDADVICLQEVDKENFQEFFQYQLAMRDYKGIFYPKSRAKTMAEREAKLVDGCAIFYKSKKFILLDKMLVDFGSNAINRLDMKGEHDIFNRVMPRDNISVVAFLENRLTGARFMAANAHIHWDPAFADVKLVQVAILLEQITKKAEEWARRPACTDKTAFRFSHSKADPADGADGESNEPEEEEVVPGPSLEYASGPQIPLVVCGDFNSAEGTGVYDLITRGEVPGNHPDLASRGYGKFTREGMHHPFKLKSAYNDIGELRFTNYTPNFAGVIDYIWYSPNSMEVKGLLGNVDDAYLQRVPGFPDAHFPSDHLALKADFTIKPLNTPGANGDDK